GVLAKLLEKDADERYQSAEELIVALEDLEGKATARPQESKKPARKKAAPKPRLAADTALDVPGQDTPKTSNMPYLLGAGVAALAVAGIVTAIAWPKQKPTVPKENDQAGVITPPDGGISQGKDGAPRDGGTTIDPRDKDKDKDRDKEKGKDSGTV